MGRWNARTKSVLDAAALQESEEDERKHDLDMTAGNKPPRELQAASTDDPPPGYLVQKGCLFPDGSQKFDSTEMESADFLGNEELGTARPRAARWSQRKSLPCDCEEVHVKSRPDSSHTAPVDPAESTDKLQRARHRQERRSKMRAHRRATAEESQRCAVLWLKDDMRLDDNPALTDGANFSSLVCVFIHDTEDPSPWPLRGAARCWKHESLKEFARALLLLGNQLLVRAGPPSDVLLQVCMEAGAEVVLWNRQCEPWYHERDDQLESVCKLNGLEVRTFKAAVLWEPWEARPDERSFNRGFGSVGFYRSAVEELGEVPEPLSPVTRLPPPPTDRLSTLLEGSIDLEMLGYHVSSGHGFPNDFRNHRELFGKSSQGSTGFERHDWAVEIREFWPAGEKHAQARLATFLEHVLAQGTYEGRERFRADQKWTAILSPYIRFGELSPCRCYWEAQSYSKKIKTEKGPRPLNSTFVRRFFWRDLAYWCLWRFPDLPMRSLRAYYEVQSWSGTVLSLKRWQRGQTGFPLVDAGMRQLWRVGWMPNYLRHVCAQFLIEFLDHNWKHGFEWFDYTLVDSDVAINAFMWQNGGHSGLDQWNFVMHPIFAAKSCDPYGDYVRRWVPELRHLPKEYIHCPWEAPQRLLLGANVILARTYYERLVEDLDKARKSHTLEVLRVRSANREMIAKGGNEWFEAKPGFWVTLITRDDFRQETDVFLTRQTADDPRHAKRRQLQDPLSLVMGDFTQQYDREHTNEAKDVL